MSSIKLFRNPERLDKNVRSKLDRQFIELTDGIVHYELLGKGNKRTVVLLHGFSTPYFIWDSTVFELVDVGFQVLRYDLYGRGYSDRPNVKYDSDLFVRQLLNLLKALEISHPVDLIGLSMGGDIASIFLKKHPNIVRRLSLIDPACCFYNKSLFSRILYSPILGEIIMLFWGEKIILSTLYKDFYSPEKFPNYKDKFSEQMKFKGFKKALLSTYRNMSTNKFTDVYKNLCGDHHQVQLIWGCEDETIPFAMNKKIKSLIPSIEFHAIRKARHIPHYEKPEIVNPILINFLTRD